MEKNQKKMHLILIRHGESQYNFEKRFTGWEDVPLTKKGKEQALEAGKKLKNSKLVFTKVYTSLLKRSINTYTEISKITKSKIKPINSWLLNERHYGKLQGLKKSEAKKKFGEKKLKNFRRSFQISPPPMKDSDLRLPHHDKKYNFINPKLLPKSESLKSTHARVLSYFFGKIVEDMKKGEKVLIVAHGNCIRVIIKEIEGIQDEKICEVEVGNCVPIYYCFDEEMKILEKRVLAGDGEEINARENFY